MPLPYILGLMGKNCTYPIKIKFGRHHYRIEMTLFYLPGMADIKGFLVLNPDYLCILSSRELKFLPDRKTYMQINNNKTFLQKVL